MTFWLGRFGFHQSKYTSETQTALKKMTFWMGRFGFHQSKYTSETQTAPEKKYIFQKKTIFDDDRLGFTFHLQIVFRRMF